MFGVREGRLDPVGLPNQDLAGLVDDGDDVAGLGSPDGAGGVNGDAAIAVVSTSPQMTLTAGADAFS